MKKVVEDAKVEALWEKPVRPYGYKWNECKNEKLLDQMRLLYQILYQHDVWYLPSNIGGNFVKGLTYEHLGKNVDLAKFGKETTTDSRINTDVRSCSWRL
jgi:hypothetical protein